MNHLSSRTEIIILTKVKIRLNPRCYNFNSLNGRDNYLVFRLKISSNVIEYGFLPLTLNRMELPLNSDC